MKSPLCTMIISIFGFPTILLLAMAAEEPDPFKSEWQDTKAHPPLNKTENQKKYFTQDLNPHKGIGMRGKACVRKEYRTLTETERKDLQTAFNLLKKTPIQNGTTDSISQYDVLVGYHRFDVAMGAHYGAAFLPWHREFLCRLERALQKHNPNVCLPYVDWTLDQALPVPGDSALWTSKYLGNNYGPVISGFAANWKVYPKDCARSSPVLYRTVVQDSTGKNRLHTDAVIDGILVKTRYPDICVPYSNAFESSHNMVHVYVGGHMSMLSCAPNDPTFYFHHCFVDCIWQSFRAKQQTSLETDYPRGPDVYEYHRADDPMRPFEGLHNIDGLSKNYTKQYMCNPRPVKCVLQKDCKSEILWCNKGRCMAKIREGGKCEKLPDVACYSEKCTSPRNVNGICKCT